MIPFITYPISGWGRFPVETGPLFRPERHADPAAILRSGLFTSYIARGLGRSYGDTAMNGAGAVIDQTRLNRFLAFDEATGVLHAEAGVSFAEIMETFLPRGWFVPVTPGTKFVTLGGAIANDVHGKNHHRDGSIGRFVDEIELLTPTGEVITCTPTRHADVFWATVGGIGLTGVMLTAKLRLKRMETAYFRVDTRKAANLEAAMALMAESDADYQHSVAWIDCLASGRTLGRSVLMRGNPARRDELSPGTEPLYVKPAAKLSVPFDFPAAALNRFSVAAFNELYYAKHSDGTHLEHLEPFFYPLDIAKHWNRMYGKRGFVQYQMVLPDATAKEGLTELLTRTSRTGRASFLAVLKRFGPSSEGYLSFPMPGFTLALDIPVDAELVPFLHELDELVVGWGGRTYLAKDSVLTRETFEKMYPRVEEFKALQRRLDPDRRMGSTMARRLGLVEA